MARIVHLAIKVDDIEKAAAFWEQVFGFRRSDVQKKRGHTSCHLTDGEFDLALVPRYPAPAALSPVNTSASGPIKRPCTVTGRYISSFSATLAGKATGAAAIFASICASLASFHSNRCTCQSPRPTSTPQPTSPRSNGKIRRRMDHLPYFA